MMAQLFAISRNKMGRFVLLDAFERLILIAHRQVVTTVVDAHRRGHIAASVEYGTAHIGLGRERNVTPARQPIVGMRKDWDERFLKAKID